MASKNKPAEKKPKERKPKATAPKGRPDTKVEHFRSSMKCDLTPDEVIDRGNRVMKLLSDKEMKQNDVKSATAHLKADIKQIDAEIGKLSKEHVEKVCYREVEIERSYVYRTGTVRDVRTDTGATVNERAMTGSERQLAPDALNKPAPKAPAPSNEEAKQEPVSDSDDEDAPDQPGSDDPPESGETPENENQDGAAAE